MGSMGMSHSGVGSKNRGCFCLGHVLVLSTGYRTVGVDGGRSKLQR